MAQINLSQSANLPIFRIKNETEKHSSANERKCFYLRKARYMR